MNDYEAGDWGCAKFWVEKKGVRRQIECCGTITIIEKKYLLFTDHDKYEYLIKRSDFKFEKKVFKDLTK